MGMQSVLSRKPVQVVVALVCFVAPLMLLPVAQAQPKTEVWQRTGLSVGTFTSITAGAGDAPALYAVQVGGGVQRSDDAGSSWQPANGGLPTGSLGEIAIHTLVTDPDRPWVIYATIDLTGQRRAIYRSSDGGRSWLPIGADFGGGRVTALAAASAGDVIYAAAGQQLFVGMNGGTAWAVQGGWGSGDEATGLVAHPQDPTRLFVMTSNAIFTSPDAGRTWRMASPPTAGFKPTAMAVAGRAASLYVASQRILYKSTDDGRSWVEMRTLPGETDIDMAWDMVDDRVGVVAVNGVVWTTTDGGYSWRDLRRGLDIASLRGLAMGQRGRIYAATTSGVWQTTISVPPLPTATATATRTSTVTPSPTTSATTTATHTATAAPTSTPSATATATPTATPTVPPPSPTVTATRTVAPSRVTETVTPTPSAPPSPTSVPRQEPSPTPEPTKPPTPAPTDTPVRPRR